tara:strand:+ start:43 stop:342 length:300 start_codon:yes stop_codon:yes gene_type:complete
MINPSASIGALANISKDVTSPQAMPLGEMPEGSVEQVGENAGVIAIFGGSGLERGVEIYRDGNGFYGDTGDFDFTANDIPDLMDKLSRIGANQLQYGGL